MHPPLVRARRFAVFGGLVNSESMGVIYASLPFVVTVVLNPTPTLVSSENIGYSFSMFKSSELSP